MCGNGYIQKCSRQGAELPTVRAGGDANYQRLQRAVGLELVLNGQRSLGRHNRIDFPAGEVLDEIPVCCTANEQSTY